ncbi:MAG: ATP-binding cassette domain-containing protein [Nitrospirae bacterium]|nr:ATP-binding cassette domain-containing protein [Nitrospirota bacterium]
MQFAVELNNAQVGMDGEDWHVDFTLAVKPGEFVLLVGPGRSGKGLLLKLCTGLVAPEQGTVRVLDRDLAALDEEGLSELRQRIGVVLQQPGLRSNMTLYTNVCLPMVYHQGIDEEELRPRVMPVLEELGLAPLQSRFPAQLTQGEARCAALARALVMDQELLLLDEVMAGLDAEMVARVDRVLTAYRRTHAVTILATLHNPSPLLEHADRIVFIRQGRVEAVGSYAEMAKTSDEVLRVYLGGGLGSRLAS